MLLLSFPSQGKKQSVMPTIVFCKNTGEESIEDDDDG
jgi:hypothetical protein